MKKYVWCVTLLIGVASCGGAPQGPDDEGVASQEQAFTSAGKFFCDDTGAGRCNYRNPRFNRSGTLWKNGGDLQLLSQSTDFHQAQTGTQHFTFKHIVNEFYQIVVAIDATSVTTDCIATSSGPFPAPRGELRALSCNSTNEFLWSFTNEPRASFQLKNKGTGECIQSDNTDFVDFSPIKTAACAVQGLNPQDPRMANQLMFLDDFSPPPTCPYIGNGLAGTSGQPYNVRVAYHQGTLHMKNPVILEFWGTYAANASLAAERNTIVANATTMLGTPAFWTRLGEYGPFAGSFAGKFASHTTWTGKTGANAITDATIQAELKKEIGSTLPLDTDNIYIVQLGPENRLANWAPGQGYHSVLTLNGQKFRYAAINYLPSDPTQLVTFDHEVTEAVTDPEPQSGYSDLQFNGDGEIGDFCNGIKSNIGGVIGEQVWSQFKCACVN